MVVLRSLARRILALTDEIKTLNKHLTTACTVCHAKELEACAHPQPFEHLGYSDVTFSPELGAAMGMVGGLHFFQTRVQLQFK